MAVCKESDTVLVTETRSSCFPRCKQIQVGQITTQELFGPNSTVPKVLGYISLDIEGAELDVISAFPFDTHCSRLWTIEANGVPAVVSRPTLATHSILT